MYQEKDKFKKRPGKAPILKSPTFVQEIFFFVFLQKLPLDRLVRDQGVVRLATPELLFGRNLLKTRPQHLKNQAVVWSAHLLQSPSIVGSTPTGRLFC